jgi:hypothetical protein
MDSVPPVLFKKKQHRRDGFEFSNSYMEGATDTEICLNNKLLKKLSASDLMYLRSVL